MINLKNRLKKWPHIKWYYIIKYKLGSIPYYVLRIFPIKKNKIVMTSFHGKYGGDPKYLSEALIDCECTTDIVWLLKEPEQCESYDVRKVRYGSLRAIYELVTAKIWVDDCRKGGHVRKRIGQFYIGTGHGGIPMKKIEKDAGDKLPLAYMLMAKNDSDMTDMKPSNSQWRNDMLRRAFWYSGEIFNCGLPRVERLIKKCSDMKTYIKRKYSLNDEMHIYLYAPTFREVGDATVYNLDYARVGKALEEKFGGHWIGLRKLHPNIKEYEIVNESNVVLDVTDYPDLEDLLMASEVLITDYSSCIFETFFLNIPAFIFATDIKEYLEKERGLYWDINNLPFPKATTNDDLVDLIKKYDLVDYNAKLKNFEKELGFFDDQTHATELLVKRIVEEMKK